MNVRELLTRWKFKADTEALHKVEGQLEAIKHRLSFLTGLELAKGLFELTEKFAHFGEELYLAAQAAGVSVESFQKLAFSASQSAISQEELGTSLKFLNKHLYDARHGGEEAIKAFRRVGFDSEQVKGFHNSQEALLAISERFKHMKDPVEKSALATALLGRNSQKMVGFLSQGSKAIRDQGSEAEKLGLILGRDQVEALIDVEHALGKVFALFKAMAATIAAHVAPLVEHMIKLFMEFVMQNRELIQVNVENWLKDFAYALGFLWAAMKFGLGLFVKFAAFFGMQDRVLTLATAIVGFSSALLILFKILSFLGPLITFGQWVISMLPVIELFVGGLVGVSVPLWAILAVVGLLIIGLQGLYAYFTGGSSWVEQFWDWFKALDGVRDILNGISGIWDKISSKFSSLGGLVKGFFGGNAPDIGAVVSGAAAPAPTPTASPALGANSQGSQVNQIDAPVTIMVPPGTPPGEVGSKVKEGISDHLSRVMRETKRSTANPVAY